jgi:membrane protease YdiL (CAAX protease family)
MDLTIAHEESLERVEFVPFTEGVLAHRQLSGDAACLLLIYEEHLTSGGEYVVTANWSEERDPLPDQLSRIPVRVVARTHGSLNSLDRVAVVLVVVGVLLVVLMRLRWKRKRHSDDWAEFEADPMDVGEVDAADTVDDVDDAGAADDAGPPALAGALWRAAVGVAGIVVVAFGVSLVPVSGALGGLLRGGIVAVAHAGLALLLVIGARGVVRLRHPARAAWLLWLTPVIGAALWASGNGLSALIPSTGVAPLQAFVSSPSGMLAVAIVAAAVPLAEELFYRGFLFGALSSRFGNGAAFAVVAIVFTVAHVAQTWGAWGSVASILLTGLVLTGLRWWTGTITVPVLTHLCHNAIIVYLSVGQT